MNNKDILAIEKIKETMQIMLDGKHPNAVEVKGCSDNINEVISLLNNISHNSREIYEFWLAIASGDFSVEGPPKSNYMAAGLKALRSRLNHITWQAQQVAKGDFDQRVDYMGEFSLAFNTMAEQLIEREGKLKAEIEERKKVELELEYYAYTDPMTGVSNRRTGLFILEKEFKKCKRDKSILSVCFIDIDGLKHVNDVYGHDEGDYLIKCVSKIVKSMIREVDMICRMGGDEFLIILPNCTANSAQKIIGRIYSTITEKSKQCDRPYALDFSYGIEETSGESHITMDELIKLADKKMYEHKMKKKI